MKMNFSQEKMKNLGKKILILLPRIMIVIFLIIFMALAYISLWPGVDEEAKSSGDKRVDSLKINLSTKVFYDLNKPVEAGTIAGSRNPFTN